MQAKKASTVVAGRAAHLAPVAIGLALVLNIDMGGVLTGPPLTLRGLGPMIVTGNLSDAWLGALAPVVGAIIAAVVHLGLSVLTDERPAAIAAPAE
jgi:glycerol uptake facilitator-like aquaporin